MDKKVFISLPIEDLQTVIIDCVNSCLKNNRQQANSKPTETDVLLTVKDTAKFLSLSVPTIYSKVSKGELPVMKRSKRLYFSSTELMAYLKGGRKKSNAEIDQDADSYLSNGKKD